MNDETMRCRECPLCGSPASLQKDSDALTYRARCENENCACEGPEYMNIDAAVSRWNTRAQASAPEVSTNRDEISSKLVDAPEGGAVAWRWRDNVQPGLPWHATTNEDVASQLGGSDGYDIEPLFTRSNAKAGEVDDRDIERGRWCNEAIFKFMIETNEVGVSEAGRSLFRRIKERPFLSTHDKTKA